MDIEEVCLPFRIGVIILAGVPGKVAPQRCPQADQWLPHDRSGARLGIEVVFVGIGIGAVAIIGVGSHWSSLCRYLNLVVLNIIAVDIRRVGRPVGIPIDIIIVVIPHIIHAIALVMRH